MGTFTFTDEQVETLKRAIIHELNDNSYCQSQAQANSLREQLKIERKRLHEVQTILNRRQVFSVNEVAVGAVNNQH